MKYNLTILFTVVFLSIFLIPLSDIQAQTTKVFTTTGTWSTPGNWSPSGAPDPADIVVINAGVTLTVDANVTCDSMYFVAGASSSTVQINSGVSLTVTNNVRFTDPSANSRTQLIDVGSGTFTCNNITFANTSATTRINRLNISTGTATINGNLVMEGSASTENQLVFSGAGKLNIGGAWTFTTATFTPSTGSVEYTSASAQNIRGTTYNKLILSGGTKTLANTAIVNDSLIISAGSILDNSANVSLTTNSVLYILGTYRESNTQGAVSFRGLIHIASGGLFQSTVNETFTITNGMQNDGTFSSGAGTYTFSTNAQQLSGTSAITFTGSVTVTGITLTNSNSSLTIGGNLTGTGTLVNSAGCTLTLNGATNSITTLNATAAGNTVVFSRAGTQTVPGTTYHHLTISSSSTKTLISDFTVNGTLTINSGPTLAVDRLLLTAGGSFATAGSTGGFLRVRNVSATPLPAGRTWAFTVNYDSTAAQTVVAGNYSNLNLTGGNRTLSSTGVIAISGTYTPGAGTITVGTSTIEFNGSSSQTIPASSYYNLTSSSTGARTLASTGTISIAGTFTPGTNTYTITGSTISYNGGADATIPNFTYQNLSVTDGFTKTLPGSLSLSGNLVLTSGKLAIGSGNTLTINGTVTSTATNCIVGGTNANLTFSGSGAATTFHLDQTTPGTTNRIETFTVNRSNITITMGNNMVVNTALNLTAGRIAPGANTLTINGTLTASSTGTISCNGSTSAVTFTGSGNTTLFLDQTTAGTTNRLGTLTFNRTGSTLTLGNATQVASSLVITAGKVSINKQTLTINGTVTSDGTNNITGGPGCLLSFGGSGDATFFLDQTTPGTTNRISTLTINRTGNTVNMGNNISLARVTLTAGRIGIGSNTLTIDSISSYIFGAAMSASANISCNGSSNLSIVTSDNANITNPTIFFDQTTDGTTNRLANFTVNLGNNTRSLTLGSNLQVATALTLTTGDLNLGSNTLTINGTLTHDANNILVANGSSNLSFTGTGSLTLFVSQTTNGTTNRLGTLTFNRSGSVLTMGNSLQTATALVLTAGQLALGSNTLTINGTVTSSASNNFIANGSSLISYTGSGDVSLFMDQTTDGTTNRLATLTINRTGNTVTMGNNLRLARLVLTAGRIGIGSNTLTMSSTSANLFGAAMSTTANISCNGSSNLSITATDNAAVTNGTLFFDATTPGTTNRLGSFTINLGATSRSLTLGSDVQVNTALTLTRGDLALGNNTLTLNGTLTNDASNNLVSGGAASIVIGGSGALGSSLFLDQTTAGTTNRLANFTYNRSSQTITLGNAMQVTGAVNPTAGTLSAGSFLTLISDATATACITAGSGSYISGNITVQRFVPAVARRFRFMSSPASGRTLADWQGEFYITGAGGSSNGFDASTNNSPTVYSYTESTSGVSDLGWTEATNITNTITTGRGYRVFIRGDRSDGGRLTDVNMTQNAVTTNVVGSVNTGDITMPVTFTNTGNGANDGWNLLGNPYPCHYDWNAFYDNGTNLTNIDPTIFIYDPNTNSYKSYNANSDVGDIAGGIIPSGSAFFVHANAASPAITFRESFKSTTAPTTLFKTNSTESGLRIALIKDSINSDATFIKYINNATEEFDLYDIEKLSGGVNISSMTDGGISLTANCKPFNGSGDTIPLNLNVRSSGMYQFQFSGATDLISDKSVVLADKLTGTIVNLRNQDSYTFEADMNNAATYGKDRFVVLVGTDLIPTGVQEPGFEEAFGIYPTVVNETLHIRRKSSKATFNLIQVYDAGGRLLMEKSNDTPEAQEYSCDMSQLGTGVYLLKLINQGNGASTVSRFVKQ